MYEAEEDWLGGENWQWSPLRGSGSEDGSSQPDRSEKSHLQRWEGIEVSAVLPATPKKKRLRESQIRSWHCLRTQRRSLRATGSMGVRPKDHQ